MECGAPSARGTGDSPPDRIGFKGFGISDTRASGEVHATEERGVSLSYAACGIYARRLVGGNRRQDVKGFMGGFGVKRRNDGLDRVDHKQANVDDYQRHGAAQRVDALGLSWGQATAKRDY